MTQRSFSAYEGRAHLKATPMSRHTEPVSTAYNFNRRKRSELLTTLMLEKAMAPAARIGLS